MGIFLQNLAEFFYCPLKRKYGDLTGLKIPYDKNGRRCQVFLCG